MPGFCRTLVIVTGSVGPTVQVTRGAIADPRVGRDKAKYHLACVVHAHVASANASQSIAGETL
jgi:hypothetical protein